MSLFGKGRTPPSIPMIGRLPKTTVQPRAPFLCVLAALAMALGADGKIGAERQPPVGENQAPVTFAEHVAPLLFKRCASCHRAGEAAPFELLTYEDARKRAEQILDVTSSRYMPPWLPKHGYGEFLGERRLGEVELKTLKDWVAQGCPQGDPALFPAAPALTPGWQLGPPDLVVESPTYSLAAEGGDQFRNFVLEIPSLESAHWVQAVEIRPSHLPATHHARLGLDLDRESTRRDRADPEPGYAGMAWGQDPDGELITWTPGMLARTNEEGSAWKLPAHPALVLHTHLQPTGKQEAISFRIGFHFASSPPKEIPLMLRVGGRHIDIPAGAKGHMVRDEFTLPVAIAVRSIFPHAHALCRSIRVIAIHPNKTESPLIWIENFDENWHDKYIYRDPVRLPEGTRIVSEFIYDNSVDNHRNRHQPPVRTVYGSNSDDEMADAYLQVTCIEPEQREVLREEYLRYETRSKQAGYRMALDKYPQDPWCLEGMAAVEVALGDPKEAISWLERSLTQTPASPDLQAKLGMALVLSRDFASAVEVLTKVTTTVEDDALAWLGLARGLDGLGKPKAAEAGYRRAIALSPGMVEAHLGLIDHLLRNRRSDDAAQACHHALSLNPNEPKLHLKQAEFLARKGTYPEALEHLTTAQQLAPYTHPPKVLLAVYCFQKGDATKAQELLQEAHQELPQHPVPELFLGQFALREQKRKEARQFLENAAQRELPRSWPRSHRERFLVLLHSERLKLAQELQDGELALSAVDSWLAVDPQNTGLKDLKQKLLRLQAGER
jgi:Flp pilus assembly protein TadD